MDEDGLPELFSELPPRGPELAWWEVSAAFPDGEAPCPPPSYPPDAGVLAVHTARLSVLMVRAGLGSEALAIAEGLLGLASAEWRVRLVAAVPVAVPHG
jgi:hypothetical protein